MSLINQLLSEHGSEVIGSLTSKLGLSEDQANSAVESVMPMVLNGLKSQKDNGGIDAVSGLLSQLGGSEDVLSNISGLMGNSGGENPLASLLGGSDTGNQVTNALGQQLGLDGDKAGSAVGMLVPVIMGFISKQGRQDPNTPDTSSGIASILDRDGDGSALDDIAAMLLKGKGGDGGGILGSIVGGLLGGKK